jgi:hypothetical protein
MLTAVGLTLVFAGLTCALGFEKYVKLYARTRDPRYRVGICAQAVMMAWHLVCGFWMLVYAAGR